MAPRRGYKQQAEASNNTASARPQRLFPNRRQGPAAYERRWHLRQPPQLPPITRRSKYAQRSVRYWACVVANTSEFAEWAAEHYKEPEKDDNGEVLFGPNPPPGPEAMYAFFQHYTNGGEGFIRNVLAPTRRKYNSDSDGPNVPTFQWALTSLVAATWVLTGFAVENIKDKVWLRRFIPPQRRREKCGVIVNLNKAGGVAVVAEALMRAEEEFVMGVERWYHNVHEREDKLEKDRRRTAAFGAAVLCSKTGLRTTEILQLQKGHLERLKNMPNGTCVLPIHFKKKETALTVFVDGDSQNFLEHLINLTPEGGGGPFHALRQGHVNWVFNTLMRSVAERLGTPLPKRGVRLGLNAVRCAKASTLLQRGYTPRDVQRFFRWRSPYTTRHYDNRITATTTLESLYPTST